MNNLLLKSAILLEENYKNIDTPTYVDYFIFLNTLIAIVELADQESFNEDYWHMYNKAKGWLKYPPDTENDHLKEFIKDELSYPILSLASSLHQKD